MTARQEILQKIKINKPPLSTLPNIPYFERPEVDKVAHFKEILQFVGGKAIEADSIQYIENEIKNIYPDAHIVCSNIPELSITTIDTSTVADPHNLQHIDLAVLKGEFGVAENAAVWVTAASLTHRAIPFITQHMALVVRKDSLVWNMHQAYDIVNMAQAGGYGVFISGPSKTADIEQSLVIGAHGSRSLVVFLI
ncbi:MAG: LUD domain-containing protein [Cytophagales bacterium]|nr:LUD domain-containing protein [Cytophagales bacterium]